jgi:hypothetical protein
MKFTDESRAENDNGEFAIALREFAYWYFFAVITDDAEGERTALEALALLHERPSLGFAAGDIATENERRRWEMSA